MAARGSNISSTHSFLPTDDEIAIMRLLNSPDGYVCCAQVCIVPAFSERAMIAAVHGSTLPAARGHQQCFQALSLNTLMVLYKKNCFCRASSQLCSGSVNDEMKIGQR